MKNKVYSITMISAFAMLLSTSALNAQSMREPDEYNVIVIIDMSGSMQDPFNGELSKLDVAKNNALEYLLSSYPDGRADTFNKKANTEYALWTFNNNMPDQYHIVVDFTTDRSRVIAELSGLGEGLGGWTPLAITACEAVGKIYGDTDLLGQMVNPGYDHGKVFSSGPQMGTLVEIGRYIYIGTDGLDNIHSGHECAGTTSLNSYDDYEEGTWQYKVKNKMKTGNPDLNVKLTGIITDADAIFSSFLGASTHNAESGAEIGVRMGQTKSTYKTASEGAVIREFYSGLTNETGGRYREATTDANGTPVLRRPGDVNRDDCVDDPDYDLIVASWGNPVTDEATALADLNGDGWVEFQDYVIWASNLGNGCSNS